MLASCIAKYCNFITLRKTFPTLAAASIATATRQPSSKKDNVPSETPKESAADDAELVQVVYVTRHGLRTPLSDSHGIVSSFGWECLSKEDTIDIFTHGVDLHRADQGPEFGSDRATLTRSRLPPGHFEPHFDGDKGSNYGLNCNSGQLTLLGHKQMRAVGEDVGKRYKETVPLLSPEWQPSEIAIRSTNSARTIETAYEIVSGMYPNRNGDSLRIELHAVNAETMYPHSSCSFLGNAFKAFRTSEERAAIKTDLANLFDKSAFKSEEEFAFWTRRSLPAMCNTLATLAGHSFPLPQGINLGHMEKVCELSGREYSTLYRADTRMVRLGIGRFLGEIVDVLKDTVEYGSASSSSEQLLGMVSNAADRVITAIEAPAPAKFVLMSGHDNTVGPLVVGLGLVEASHPPMGSGLAFELYKKPVNPENGNSPASKSSSASSSNLDSEYFVQAVFNMQPLPMPGCGNKLRCPFDEFVEKVATPFIPANYHAECDQLIPELFKQLDVPK